MTRTYLADHVVWVPEPSSRGRVRGIPMLLKQGNPLSHGRTIPLQNLECLLGSLRRGMCVQKRLLLLSEYYAIANTIDQHDQQTRRVKQQQRQQHFSLLISTLY